MNIPRSRPWFCGILLPITPSLMIPLRPAWKNWRTTSPSRNDAATLRFSPCSCKAKKRDTPSQGKGQDQTQPGSCQPLTLAPVVNNESGPLGYIPVTRMCYNDILEIRGVVTSFSNWFWTRSDCCVRWIMASLATGSNKITGIQLCGSLYIQWKCALEVARPPPNHPLGVYT